jgi:uncharacterized protein
MKVFGALLLSASLCVPAYTQVQPAPIIDMHLHALSADAQGPPPLNFCAPPSHGYPPADTGSSWGATFLSTLKSPPCDHPIRSPLTDRELMDRTLAILKHRNIYAVTSGPLVEQWQKEGGDRVIPGMLFGLEPNAASVNDVRGMFESGRYSVLGEVGLQYQGIDPSDPRFEPYLAIAEELDIPVGIHMGPGPPGAPYFAAKDYRAKLHSPLSLEEALLRHPKLRVYVMHAGWPMLDDMLAMLWTHPQLYVDVGVIGYAIPRAAFHDYLHRIVQAGFEKRILFGSDQLVWPEAVEVAIESIETAEFLSQDEKRDILYNNAARFLRLTPAQIAKQRRGD